MSVGIEGEIAVLESVIMDEMATNGIGMGNRIRRLRELIGMSQIDLTKALANRGVDVNQGHVSNIERDNRSPSIELLRALAVVLETNTDYLLGLTDDDRPPSDLEDQVVVTVEDPHDRMLVQEIADLLVRAPSHERAYIADLVRRAPFPAHLRPLLPAQRHGHLLPAAAHGARRPDRPAPLSGPGRDRPAHRPSPVRRRR